MTPRCLDLTRLVSRVGSGPPTGVDRVELAYLDALLARNDPMFVLCRTAAGFSLLDRAGGAALRARLIGNDWGPQDLLSRVSRRLPGMRRRAEADLRRLAIGNALRSGLARLAARHLPAGTRYLNTGHSHLDTRSFEALRAVEGLKIAVLIHDTIPLDYPQYQRPGTPEVFARRMRAVSAGADLVICNSAQTENDVQRHFATFGRVPTTTVAHLGVDRPRPDPVPPPLMPAAGRPYFVALSTIEPRKNHALLLDVWAHLDETAPERLPQLLILGRRGWNNAAVFARLDAGPHGVAEHADLDDGAVAALISGARALLFPSFAEGFGLPPVEAAALGTPVLCSPLPVLREVLGAYPVYLDPGDMYRWAKEISRLAAQDRDQPSRVRQAPPTWTAHFNHVFTMT